MSVIFVTVVSNMCLNYEPKLKRKEKKRKSAPLCREQRWVPVSKLNRKLWTYMSTKSCMIFGFSSNFYKKKSGTAIIWIYDPKEKKIHHLLVLIGACILRTNITQFCIYF